MSIAPLVLLGFALDALIVTSEESAKALGELNETIFKLQETKVDMTQKIDRFEELRDKVFKTNEELIEMQELIKDINRMGAEAGMKDPVIGFDLSVNREGLENQLNLGISAAEKEAGKHARNLIGTFFHRVKKQNKKFLTLSEDQKMAFTREIAKNMLGVDEETLKKMTADELADYGKRLEVLTVSVRSNLVDMHEKHNKEMRAGGPHGATQLTLTDFSFKVLSEGDMALTNAQITEIQTLVDNIDLEGLTSKFDSLTDTQKIFARSLFGNLDGLVTALQEGDISEQVIENLGGLQRVSRMIVSLSQVKTSEGLKLTATEMGLFLDALNEADKRFPDSIPEKVSFFSNAVQALGKQLGIAVPQLEALKLNLMGDFGLNDSELEKDLNKVKNTGEEARRLMNAALRLQKGEALDDDMIDLQVNYSDLMEKITEGSLTYADVVARVATITKADLEERVRQAALARDALDPTTDAFRKAQDEFLAFQRLLLSYDTFVSESAGEGDSEKRLNVFKPQIDAIKQEIALRKQLNQQHNDEIDAIQKKMDLQKSQLDLDRRIAALKKDTSIGAQAELAKAEDQKRKLTVDQNKFIRDSAMKEEIALLEAQKQSLMVSQQEETNRILLETLEENRRARQNQTFNPFASTTGS